MRAPGVSTSTCRERVPGEGPGRGSWERVLGEELQRLKGCTCENRRARVARTKQGGP